MLVTIRVTIAVFEEPVVSHLARFRRSFLCWGFIPGLACVRKYPNTCSISLTPVEGLLIQHTKDTCCDSHKISSRFFEWIFKGKRDRQRQYLNEFLMSWHKYERLTWTNRRLSISEKAKFKSNVWNIEQMTLSIWLLYQPSCSVTASVPKILNMIPPKSPVASPEVFYVFLSECFHSAFLGRISFVFYFFYC